jgi:glucosylceramidase
MNFRPILTCLALLAAAEAVRAQTVNVWLTTHDQSKLLTQQGSIAFSSGSPGNNCIVVDETQVYQPIEGFGAAFTDTTGYILHEVASGSARTNAMQRLFTRTGSGIGLTFMRIPMGASDLARYQYSYDDLPAGQTDTNLTNFSIAHDLMDIVPLIQQARQLNPDLKLMANPWSPPGWMKDSGAMVGGSLLPSMYGPFANYFVKFLQAYQAQGISVDYISLQNEPLYVPGDYPGMFMDATNQMPILRDYVLPALNANLLTTKVLVYDHNWDRPDYPQTVYADPTVLAATNVAGTAWHGYGGGPGAMLPLASQFPAKGNYETEHSGGTWVSDQLVTDFEEIIHVMRSWGRSFVKWNLAGDQNDGPHSGGCGTCTPLVSVNTNTGVVSYTIDFYTLGHFSKFVLPGAYRIYSANVAGIISAAFLNADGSKVLVAFNDSPGAVAFQVQWGSQVLSYSLPGNACVTFTWAGTQSGVPSLNATNQIRVSSFSSVSSLQTEQTTDTLGGYDLGFANSGSYAVYRNVNFSSALRNLSARVASAGSGGSLQFRLDAPTGAVVGTVPVPVTGGWQTWQTTNGFASGTSGLHDLYVVFQGGSGVGNLNWFQFAPASQPLPNPWANGDVGNVGFVGGAGYSAGIFTVTGSGDDIWNNADAFQFVNQPVAGQSEIRARVVSVQNTDPWSKAGVMIRSSTASGSINVAVLVTPGNGVTFQVRGTTGAASTSTTVAAVTAPRWVRLVRSPGNPFTAYSLFTAWYSSNGTTWTQIGATNSVAMNNAALAGLAVCAHNNTNFCTATFDNVTVNQAPLLAQVPNQTIVGGGLLMVTNSASDADVPAQSLAFNLLSAPAGSAINTNSGVFTWRPTVAQSPSTQSVTEIVTDTGVPPMSATQSFLVAVMRPAAPQLTAGSISNGQFGFWINGDVGPDYTIQVSTNLTDWSTLVTSNSPSLPYFWIDPDSAVWPMRFYRALLGP